MASAYKCLIDLLISGVCKFLLALHLSFGQSSSSFDGINQVISRVEMEKTGVKGF